MVVERFITRRTESSLDGSVYTTGEVLCVGSQHVAFWHQGTIYLVHVESPDTLVKEVQAMVRLGTHGHKVAEMGEQNESV